MDKKQADNLAQDKEAKELPNIDATDHSKKEDQPESIQYDVTHAPTPHVVKVKRSPLARILTVLMIILLIGSNGYTAYMYLQEKDNANNLQQQLNKLQSTVGQSQNTNQETQTQEELVSYSADIGDFSLTLANKKYAIIKKLDANFEGGPATVILIGDKQPESSVIDYNYTSELEITALPASNFQDNFESFKESKIQDRLERTLDSVNIDGVEADNYLLGGLFYDQLIVFENNGIYYSIVASQDDDNVTSISGQKLEDVISGFKFSQ